MKESEVAGIGGSSSRINNGVTASRTGNKKMKLSLTSLVLLILLACPTMSYGKKDKDNNAKEEENEDLTSSTAKNTDTNLKATGEAGNTVPIPTVGTSIENPFDVLIIGAGWSGISAAKTLLDDDITSNFGIIEARDYVGGRSHTVNGQLAPGVITELGSAWIYPKTNVAGVVDDVGLEYSATDFSYATLGIYDEMYGKLDDFDKEVIVNDYFFSRFTPFAQKHSGDGSISKIRSEFFEEENLEDYSAAQGTTSGGNFSLAESYENNKYRQGVNGLINENIVVEYGANLDMLDPEASLSFLGCEYEIDYMAVPGTFQIG